MRQLINLFVWWMCVLFISIENNCLLSAIKFIIAFQCFHWSEMRGVKSVKKFKLSALQARIKCTEFYIENRVELGGEMVLQYIFFFYLIVFFFL